MKHILKTQVGTAVLAVASGLVVAVVAWKLGGDWWNVRGAIQDIAAVRGVAQARTKLERLNDRGYVLEKLEAAVADDSFNVRGKIELLTTLNMLSQPRALRRALDSSSQSAQRAACAILYGDADSRTRCGEIALAWLKDEADPDRSIAAMICNQLRLDEAQPALLAIVEKDPTTQDDLRLFQQALFALRDPKPLALIDRLLRMVADPKLDTQARSVALDALQRTKEGPRDQILTLAIGILTDRAADSILRMKAAATLQWFPEDRARQALEEVLLAETPAGTRDLQFWIVQRNCLYSLGMMSPSDAAVAERYRERLIQLLLDRRVYHSPYFATRVDVTTALCALNVREPIVIDIMADYLVDEDKDDKEHLVRQQAWLTLWTLTGERLDDVPRPELFDRPPPPFTDREAMRDALFNRGKRPGIDRDRNAAVAMAAKDLAWMQKARQVYQSGKARIVERWRSEAAKAEEAKKAAQQKQGAPAQQEPKKEDPPTTHQGPTKEDAGGTPPPKPN